MDEAIPTAGLLPAAQTLSGFDGQVDLRGRVLELVRQVLELPKTAALPLTRPVNELGMSSLKLVNLMLAIEAEFDLSIPQREITPENFDTLERIEALVKRLVS